MLYELIAVVRPGRINEVKEIAKTAGNLVISRNGVVRGFTNWGTFLLPKPMIKYQAKHHHGHYFVMRFDSSASTQHALRETLNLDPRMLRWSVVKMGTKLEDIADIPGRMEWGGENVASDAFNAR